MGRLWAKLSMRIETPTEGARVGASLKRKTRKLFVRIVNSGKMTKKILRACYHSVKVIYRREGDNRVVELPG